MKTIQQDTPFLGNTIKGSGGVIYTLKNKREEIITDDSGEKTIYKADGFLPNEDIKEYYESNIITDDNFHGDTISRVDMLTPIVLMLAQSLDREQKIPVPSWKKANGVVPEVTVGEFLDAIGNSLAKKGANIGIE